MSTLVHANKTETTSREGGETPFDRIAGEGNLCAWKSEESVSVLFDPTA